MNQLGMSATAVGDKLGITGMAVGKCADRAEKRLLCREMRSLFNWYDTQRIIAEYLS